MLTTEQVCDVTGCTYRQLDHWTRCGVVAPTVPARGSGSRRAFTEDDTCIVALCVRLARLNCPYGVMAAAGRAMEGMPPACWTGLLVVSPTGDVRHDVPVTGAAWVVDLAACRDTVTATLDTIAA